MCRSAIPLRRRARDTVEDGVGVDGEVGGVGSGRLDVGRGQVGVGHQDERIPLNVAETTLASAAEAGARQVWSWST